MKILNYFLTVLFVLFAAVQYNDADPWLWIPIYLFVAIMCFMATMRKFSKPALWIGTIAMFLGSIYYFPGVYELFTEHEAREIAAKMKADQPYIEKARESLGLLIAVITQVYLLLWSRKTQKGN